MRFASVLPRTRIVDREAFIVSLCSGQRVLHLGCVDSGLLSERLASGSFLHASLANVSRDLWGVDLDAEGVEKLKRAGFHNTHAGSAEAIPLAIPRDYFDIVLAGELIEHVSNPGLLLDSAATCCKGTGSLVITTPNGLRFSNLLSCLIGAEIVHPDHTLSFTPATLQRLIWKHNLETADLLLFQGDGRVKVANATGPVDKTLRLAYNLLGRPALRMMLWGFPYLADGIIAVAKPRPEHTT